jgi:hypothetical protein
MSGLLRRLRSRRPSTAGGEDPRPDAHPHPVDAPAPGDETPVAGDAPSAESPDGPPEARPVALPAGVDPEELEARPEPTVRRSRLRRRLRYLRAVREVLLRDLGGFVLELHRTAGDHELEQHRRLRADKLARLLAVEEEAHAIEARLGEATRTVVIREPGLGGECVRCGELLGSDARYCSRCGLPVHGIPAEPVAEPLPVQDRPVEVAREAPRDEEPRPAPDDTPTESVPVLEAPYAAPGERRR